jgi:TRAP-type mannitol/chloroaromatic compound transport system permease small subunit
MISGIIKLLGEKFSLVYMLLVILIFTDVAVRTVTNKSQVWMGELEWQIFALLFLIGMSFAFQEDKHVRIDLFYNKFPVKKQLWTDVMGNIIFLIPWCIVVIITGYKYASNSWYIHEGSANPGGLPAKYIIKSMISISFLLLLITGINETILKIKKLKNK